MYISTNKKTPFNIIINNLITSNENGKYDYSLIKPEDSSNNSLNAAVFAFSPMVSSAMFSIFLY